VFVTKHNFRYTNKNRIWGTHRPNIILGTQTKTIQTKHNFRYTNKNASQLEPAFRPYKQTILGTQIKILCSSHLAN
jgi:hypothetical protein